MAQPEASSTAPADSHAPSPTAPTGDLPAVVPLAPSARGRVSGKAWKVPKSATVRSHLPDGVKTTKWEARMEKTKKEQAIKKLQAELKQEKADEIKRRKEITLERKKAAEERQRLEEAKAKVRSPTTCSLPCDRLTVLEHFTQMGAKRAARLRRKMGRTKKINH
ncbi:hypothetical protein BD413DRAFT_465035 [Trametes elegans]|nr:hypothetical protein BD413DRAFT_465035 [Trametes elegans]